MKDFINLFEGYTGPALAMVLADNEGNIGFVAPGAHPIRLDPFSGSHVKKGWAKEHDWQGFVEWKFVPKVYNPPKGYIISAN